MRFLALTILIPILGFTHGWLTHPQPTNKPPKITCPKVRTLYTAEKKRTTTVVTWPLPRASDPEGRHVIVKLKTSKGPGSYFGRGTHTVMYEAKDDKGLTDVCMFTFTVKVIRCPMPGYLRNGRIHCDGGNYGHTCKIICDKAYILGGCNDMECLRSGQWDHPMPKCIEDKECPVLANPPNSLGYMCTNCRKAGSICQLICDETKGYAPERGAWTFCLVNHTWTNLGMKCQVKQCPVLANPPNSLGYMCTNRRKTGSICMLRCDETKGYAPERGAFTMCFVNQNWTNLGLKCQDIEAPQIHNCPTQMLVQSKDSNAVYTFVKWEKPLKVTDNSGDDLKPIGAQGNATGGLFEEGVTLVRFIAQDRAGNTSPMCSFIVMIQTQTCDPPKMEDQYLGTPGCVGFREGQSCSLKCYLALELVGPTVITCKKDNSSSQLSKGYWSYGQNESTPAEKPYCRVHNCTDLRAPKFGAISCDEWELGRNCSISCRQGYDIPFVASVPELYTCGYSTGRWNSDHVPDCAWKEHAKKKRMKGYHYFTGSCSVSREVIKQNFLTVINDQNACPSDKYCTVENVNVRCGAEPEDELRRRKRTLRYRRRGRSILPQQGEKQSS